MNWNDQKVTKSRIEKTLESYEDKNSESVTSYEDWKSAMRSLEGNFDHSFAKAIKPLNDSYQTEQSLASGIICDRREKLNVFDFPEREILIFLNMRNSYLHSSPKIALDLRLQSGCSLRFVR
ncbi:hypothetical protein CH375_00140 [Leptospira ellisii]|uniref:Uncharacterized protein n=1 Tax=Leptospira ellisii TaxID=2023197 RepID=A0A2N0B8Q9_9LEPT|nr:hypothetical protein CH379_10540 [Leptospira ellisii]PKA06349.1 hypothetical protein CH375_00140 [Leptospira ellisii]